jgi:hypothetical protein
MRARRFREPRHSDRIELRPDRHSMVIAKKNRQVASEAEREEEKEPDQNDNQGSPRPAIRVYQIPSQTFPKKEK